MNKRQKGFTLVEIAIVLIIIGLLLGGILKGQELINSARVRNLADQSAAVQTAYYGFIDRYRQVPGDWAKAEATRAIGKTVNTPAASGSGSGVGNGRVDNNFAEAAAVWEQLARAEFLSGGFTPATRAPASETAYAKNAPLNAFNGPLILTQNQSYTDDDATPPARLNLHLGRNIPVNIARELDVKIDDGLPNTGSLRLTRRQSRGATFTNNFASNFGTCSSTAAATPANGDGQRATDIYDIADDDQDCGPVFLY